jgi:hypothetical protein
VPSNEMQSGAIDSVQRESGLSWMQSGTDPGKFIELKLIEYGIENSLWYNCLTGPHGPIGENLNRNPWYTNHNIE